MKRHAAFIPLSREHHEVLVLAQLLKKDAPPYKGLPKDTDGKRDYALGFYTEHIIGHFYTEERTIFPALTGYDHDIDLLIQELRTEHSQIISLFEQLRHGVDPAGTMDFLGKLLITHVRKEERELFEKAQDIIPAEILEKLVLHPVK